MSIKNLHPRRNPDQPPKYPAYHKTPSTLNLPSITPTIPRSTVPRPTAKMTPRESSPLRAQSSRRLHNTKPIPPSLNLSPNFPNLFPKLKSNPNPKPNRKSHPVPVPSPKPKPRTRVQTNTPTNTTPSRTRKFTTQNQTPSNLTSSNHTSHSPSSPEINSTTSSPPSTAPSSPIRSELHDLHDLSNPSSLYDLSDTIIVQYPPQPQLKRRILRSEDRNTDENTNGDVNGERKENENGERNTTATKYPRMSILSNSKQKPTSNPNTLTSAPKMQKLHPNSRSTNTKTNIHNRQPKNSKSTTNRKTKTPTYKPPPPIPSIMDIENLPTLAQKSWVHAANLECLRGTNSKEIVNTMGRLFGDRYE